MSMTEMGLSFKALGRNEYQRRWNQTHVARKTGRRRWTGLSRKTLGETPYRAAYRALIRENLCNPCL